VSPAKCIDGACSECGYCDCVKREWLKDNQWISVEDELPPKEEFVKIKAEKQIFPVIDGCTRVVYKSVIRKALISEEDIWYLAGNKGELLDVKYWMPLPEPPEKE
jgi:hypothetical protein